MSQLVHQVVTIYKDDNAVMVGVCSCGKVYPLENTPQHGETTMASHISLENRTEAASI
jgi:hypothetical protein